MSEFFSGFLYVFGGVMAIVLVVLATLAVLCTALWAFSGWLVRGRSK